MAKPEIISPKDKDQTFGFTGAEPVTFAWMPVSTSSNVTYTLEIADSLHLVRPHARQVDRRHGPEARPQRRRLRIISGCVERARTL